MHAALVTSFDRPPRPAQVKEPPAPQEGERVVELVAAGVHPLVRSRAAGAHYTSGGELPLVPGIDAVVREADGSLSYTVLDPAASGSMTERMLVEDRRTVPLPQDVDPVIVAAGMNPAMSSWVALRRRIDFHPGQRVLILGASGSAGRLAVQVAKRFGAAEVIGAGRDAARLAPLAALGADRTLTLDRLREAADVDVVIDYVWGEPTARGMLDIVSHRADRKAQLTWIQVGSLAGAAAALPSAAFRAARLQLVGSGIGSVPASDFVAELPQIAQALAAGDFDVRARAVPLAQVESAWTETEGDERLVIVP